MKRLATMLLVGLWLTAAGRLQALDLGDIEVGSLRGEPLMARIALVELADGDPGNLEVGLAAPEEFARAGIERHDHLLSLEFEVVAEGGEPAHIMIRGRDPIDSPSATFLVEAVWPAGRTLREYTVLLDAAPPGAVASYGPVHRTDTLWSLAGRYRPEGVSVQRMMLTMLALNPHAFSMANVNALREGAILEIPSLERIGPDEKDSAIREVLRQNEAWKAYFPSTGEQVGAAADIEAPVSADPEAATPPPETAPDGAGRNREATGQGQDAKVRVVVPGTAQSADADQQQKLRAELHLALEEADSKRQEIFELSARLDEAEQLIADLQRLVELKDDDIAALQARVAAEAEAAEQVRSEIAAQARAAAQAEAAERAREEARLQTEAAAAPVEVPAPVDTTVAARTEMTDPAPPAPVPEPLLPEEQQEAGTEGPSDSATSPPVLRSLEDMLGFSPVVGGVGLVGVILILGGLIALMRRRGATPEDSDDDVTSAEDDAESDFWGDEAEFEEEGVGFGDDDASALPAEQASKGKRTPSDSEPEMDDFDIGIDLDEELTRTMEQELEAESDIEGRPTARARTSSPAGDRAAGRAPPRSDFGLLPDVGSEFASRRGDDDMGVDLGVRQPGEPEGASLAPGRQGASSRRPGDADPLEGVAAFAAGEGLSGDVDELQTKLDLAQTYIDMEDFENARTLLREVQSEGELEQRAIARYLAGKLP